MGQGRPGIQGTQGQQGIQGITGASGAVGTKGDSGLLGPQGLIGLSGIQGLQGETGLIGPSGGVRGPMGPQGVMGPLGEGSLYLRNIGNTDNGLKWNSDIDGPRLYGNLGGALGNGGENGKNIITWDASGNTTIKGQLYAQKDFVQFTTENTDLSSMLGTLESCQNACNIDNICLGFSRQKEVSDYDANKICHLKKAMTSKTYNDSSFQTFMKL